MIELSDFGTTDAKWEKTCLFVQIYSHNNMCQYASVIIYANMPVVFLDANMWETVSCNFNFHTYKSHNTSERLRGIFSKSLFPIFYLWPMVTSIFSQVRSLLHHVGLPVPLGADEQGAGNRSLWQWLWWQWKWFFGSDHDLSGNGQCYWKPFSPFSPHLIVGWGTWLSNTVQWNGIQR